MRILVLVFVALIMNCVASAEESPQLHLMPWPARVTQSEGRLVIQNSFAVNANAADPRLQKTIEIFLDDLRRHTGSLPLDFKIVGDPDAAQLRVTSEGPSKEVPELGEDESYSLEVTPTEAKLSAPTSLGVMRGLQTFLQLVEITPQGFAVPAVAIHDRPRFPWRGLLIDPGRHFIPLEVVKRNLDGMAAVKLNVLHWHLSDNQGFRIESKKFPKLHEKGSDGLYYTQEQVKDIIAYARDRGIRIIPEFDMPGHSTSWFVGYPELGSGPGPYSLDRSWGVKDPAMDPTRESTYKFLDTFIGEMAALFPDKYFHIGGDEVNGKEWDANANIQAFMRAHGLKSNADLQAYFNSRVQKIVSKHGKYMEGWDEILRPDLPKSIVIQSWRGQKSLAEAAKQGYRGLLSSGYYLDLNQPASAHYKVDPFTDATAGLSESEREKILGGEACMWGEYVAAENIDSRIWPRLAAVAERLWSPQNVTDINSMYERMAYTSQWLDAYGLTQNINYELMLQRMAGSDDISALRTLIDVVEPVKNYSREALAATPATSFTPLNRAIDAAHPESEAAREFSALVDSFVSGQLKPGLEMKLRESLLSWKNNEHDLQPTAARSQLVAEVAPLSHDLSALASAGLLALEYLDRGEKAPQGWATEQLAMVQQAFQPKAQLLLMVAPPVQKLIQASAGETPTVLPMPRAD